MENLRIICIGFVLICGTVAVLGSIFIFIVKLFGIKLSNTLMQYVLSFTIVFGVGAALSYICDRVAKRKGRNGQGPSSPSDHVTSLRNHPLLCELSAYSAITKLVDETWNHGEDLKASYKHGEPHEHVKITHVFKVKNGKLLEQYNNNNKKAQVTQMNDMPNELKQNPIITANVGNVQCDQEKEVKLNVGYPNEVYLFHGTKLEHVTGIIEHGFDPKRAKRKRFGTAIYMTESPEKADQYTVDPSKPRTTDLAMLLVRVTLGKVKCNMNGEKATKDDRREFDTVVITGVHNRFREFLLFDQEKIYPEFVIIYNRKL